MESGLMLLEILRLPPHLRCWSRLLFLPRFYRHCVQDAQTFCTVADGLLGGVPGEPLTGLSPLPWLRQVCNNPREARVISIFVSMSKSQHPSIEVRPSVALETKRTNARDYNFRVIGPVLERALTCLRLQNPVQQDVFPAFHRYLKTKLEGREPLPNEERQVQPLPGDDGATIPSDFLVPVLCDLVREMPDEHEAISVLLAHVESSMKEQSAPA